MNQELIYIEQFFHPEGWSGAEIPKDITYALQKEGWSVKVICGDKYYLKPDFNNKQILKQLENIHIKRIKLPFEQSSFLKKFINQLIFSFFSFKTILFSKNISLVLLQTNPPPLIIFVAAACKIKKIPFIVIAMDVYPEILLNTLNKKITLLLKFLLNPIFNHSFRSANKIVSLGQKMTEILEKKGIENKNIFEIPNWATGKIKIINDKEKNPLFSKWGIKSQIRLLYSGNLGRAHDWETLFEAIKISNLPPDKLQVIIVASGKRLKEAKEYANKFLRPNSIIFKKLVDPKQLPFSMGLANLAFLSIRSNYEGLVVPSKFVGYLARSLPVIYVGPSSEISEIINANNCGFSFYNNESYRLSKKLIELAENPSYLKNNSISSNQLYKNYFSKKQGIRKYIKLTSYYKNQS